MATEREWIIWAKRFARAEVDEQIHSRNRPGRLSWRGGSCSWRLDTPLCERRRISALAAETTEKAG